MTDIHRSAQSPEDALGMVDELASTKSKDRIDLIVSAYPTWELCDEAQYLLSKERDALKKTDPSSDRISKIERVMKGFDLAMNQIVETDKQQKEEERQLKNEKFWSEQGQAEREKEEAKVREQENSEVREKRLRELRSASTRMFTELDNCANTVESYLNAKNELRKAKEDVSWAMKSLEGHIRSFRYIVTTTYSLLGKEQPQNDLPASVATEDEFIKATTVIQETLKDMKQLLEEKERKERKRIFGPKKDVIKTIARLMEEIDEVDSALGLPHPGDNHVITHLHISLEHDRQANQKLIASIDQIPEVIPSMEEGTSVNSLNIDDLVRQMYEGLDSHVASNEEYLKQIASKRMQRKLLSFLSGRDIKSEEIGDTQLSSLITDLKAYKEYLQKMS